MQALVFDFNGTMFLDTDKQRKAWDEFFARYIGRPLTQEEFLRHACGPDAAWSSATSAASRWTRRASPP